MGTTRSLSLHRETLVELTPADLSAVVGANAIQVMHTTVQDTCLTCQTSINGQCNS